MDNNNEEKNSVMVSNLPLLFSDGNPTSVASMSVEDLQYFIPFLLKCILGCEPSGWAKHQKFKWWPADVPWSPIILTKKYQTPIWRSKLQRVVRCCYDYNGCGYLLQFSAKLQQLIGTFKFKDNWDGTTSMFDSNSGKLLVTFRNENMNYDYGLRQQLSNQRPMLLPRLNSPGSPTKLGPPAAIPSLAMEAPSSPQMVEPPVCDVYLCDYCGADFSTLSAIKSHETNCAADKALEATAAIALPDLDTKEIDQAKFMWCLSLSCRDQSAVPAILSPTKARPFVKKACTLGDKRFSAIPFSSDLAQSFFKKTSLTPAVMESLVNRYEKLCVSRPKVSYTSSTTVGDMNRLRPLPPVKRKDEWVHLYCFTKSDRKERMKTIDTGLTKRARWLYRQCTRVSVILQRLTQEEISDWTSPKPKLHPDTTFIQALQKSIANLSPDCTISLAPVDSISSSWMRSANPKHVSPSLSVSRATPSLVISRSETARLGSSIPKPQQHKTTGSGKPPIRSPPALLPLITNAWSMQTMQSVRPQVKNQFILPDLIPVQRNPAARRPNPVIIQMPSVPSPSKPVLPCKRSGSLCADLVDLCSSDEEADTKQSAVITGVLDRPIVLPPCISVTQVNREANGQRRHLPPGPRSRSSEAKHKAEIARVGSRSPPSNGSHLRASPSLSFSVRSSPPALKFMGQPKRRVQQASLSVPPPALSMDTSLPIVTPLKLGKLPAEKREQMKQSLLKIQKKEGKSPTSGSEKGANPANSKEPKSGDSNGETGRASPLSSIPVVSNGGGVPRLLEMDCGDLKRKGLHQLMPVDERRSRRKRAKDSSFDGPADEMDSPLSEAPCRKTQKLDDKQVFQSHADDGTADDGFSTVIEVDVGAADYDTHEGSRGSSFGSLTPDNRNSRKKSELSRLLEDECKELRRKGLEELPFDTASNQRVTRCRTRSLPLSTTKV